MPARDAGNKLAARVGVNLLDKRPRFISISSVQCALCYDFGAQISTVALIAFVYAAPQV